MGKGRSPWQDGRRAWERLNGWHQEGPSARPGHPDDGDGALTALPAVCRVRHLLEQAELVAVKPARRHGKSWAEIATKLGVTRQSAWERWRDLDEEQPAAAPDVLGELADAAAREITRSRRAALGVVPNVTGLEWETAHRVLTSARLAAVSADPDGPPIPVLQFNGSVVVD